MAGEDKEIWKNESAGYVGVNLWGARGEVVQKMVAGGRNLYISTEERTKLNPVAEGNNDPFKDGTLSVVTMLDDAEDLEEIQANANIITEEEMLALVKGHHKTFEKALVEISSPGVLARIREVAVAENVSIGTVTKIDDRIASLDIKPTEGHVKFKAFTDGLNPKAASS